MRATLADSDWAPSAVHAILEIGMAPGINARDLGNILRLDKSNTSRQLARLEAAGVVERRVSSDDARAIELYLTAEGKSSRRESTRSRRIRCRTRCAAWCPPTSRRCARSRCMPMRSRRTTPRKRPSRHSTRPRSEKVTNRAASAISRAFTRVLCGTLGLRRLFEKRVATELAEFAGALPADGKALWLCQEDGRTLASLAIDGDPATGVAHLRWFIVNDALRGSGIGRRLMTEAMRFVDAQRFRETYLWTFKGLDSARHLYESFGFALTSESAGTHWGTEVVEQRFSRPGPSGG